MSKSERPTELLLELREAQIKNGVEVRLLKWIDLLEAENDELKHACQNIPDTSVIPELIEAARDILAHPASMEQLERLGNALDALEAK